MAARTVSLDVEAYELLARRRRPGQSFSEVVKEHFGRPKTASDLLAAVREARLPPETLDAIDLQIEARRDDLARAARW